MLNLQLKLGAFGQNAQGFEKDYRGEPEPPARGLGSVLPEIKNYGAGGEFVRERLEGTNKEGFGVSRYEFIRNQQRIEYPSVLFPQAPLAYAKEQIKQIAKMLMKDYAEIRNSYLPDSAKQDMITQALLKVKGFPAPLVRVADKLVENRLDEYLIDDMVDADDVIFESQLDELLAQMEAPELTNVILSGSGSQNNPYMRELAQSLVDDLIKGAVGRIAEMKGEGGDVEDIVASENSVPLRVAGLVPESMDAMSESVGFQDPSTYSVAVRMYDYLRQKNPSKYEVPKALRASRGRPKINDESLSVKEARDRFIEDRINEIRGRYETTKSGFGGIDPEIMDALNNIEIPRAERLSMREQTMPEPRRRRQPEPSIRVETPVRITGGALPTTREELRVLQQMD